MSIFGGMMGIRRPLAGMRRRRPRRRIAGKGIFGDIWSGIKKVGSLAAPIATPLLTNLVMKKLGGMRKRRRVRRRVGGVRKRRVVRGRGLLSALIGGLTGLGRKRRVVRRRRMLV